MMTNFEDMLWLFDLDKTRGISRLNLDEAAVLWKEVRRAPDGVIIEIGAMHNGTTCLLSHACKPLQEVISYDINHQRNPRAMQEMRGDVTLIEGNSALVDPPVHSLLFVDGDHSYEGVKRDIEAFWPKLKCGCVALFHDAAPNLYPGWCSDTRKAIYEMLFRRSKVLACVLNEVRSMLVVRKLAEL